MNDLIFPVLGSTNHMNLSEVLDLFKTQFFAIVRQHLGVVQKCWITGVLPVSLNSISPLLFTTDISASPMYHGLCGFTDREVQVIARTYLSLGTDSKDLIQLSHQLKQSYGGHRFGTGSSVDFLHNPHHICSYLRTVAQEKSVIVSCELSAAVHSQMISRVFSITGKFSLPELFTSLCGELQARILPCIGPAEMESLGSQSDVVWSLLYYNFGIVARGFGERDLSIPNTTMRHLVCDASVFLVTFTS
jgi:hypothetical protein